MDKRTGRVVWQDDSPGAGILHGQWASAALGLVYVSDLNGILHCLDANTGTPRWTFDMVAPVWGSPLLADGKVFLGDEDGDIAVLKAGPELQKIAEIDMGDWVHSSPVAAKGVLYVMTGSSLYAIAAPAVAKP